MFKFIKNMFFGNKIDAQNVSLKTLKPFFEKYLAKNESPAEMRSLMSGVFYGAMEVIDKLKQQGKTFNKSDLLEAFDKPALLEFASLKDKSADNLRDVLQEFNLVQAKFIHDGDETIIKYIIKNKIATDDYRMLINCVYNLQEFLEKAIREDNL
jgi:hypothetical protein